ncbi:MAG TPA: TonB family protein [Acidobacteriota bacterium]|nr:TonB family protein [Acidobacteriota bacterium]HNT16980.1 TonB family protein [Acidobacteriota bacterium]HPA26770.1 TonB family protein [Acidobacteriota bacterium]
MTPREFLTFILDKLRPYRDRWVSPVSFLIAVVIHLLIISLGTSHYTGASSHPERSNQAVQKLETALKNKGVRFVYVKDMPEGKNLERMPAPGAPLSDRDRLGSSPDGGRGTSWDPYSEGNSPQRQFGSPSPRQAPPSRPGGPFESRGSKGQKPSESSSSNELEKNSLSRKALDEAQRSGAGYPEPSGVRTKAAEKGLPVKGEENGGTPGKKASGAQEHPAGLTSQLGEMMVQSLQGGYRNLNASRLNQGAVSFETSGWDLGPYARIVQEKVESNWRMPAVQEVLRQKGWVAIRFDIMKDGRVENLEIVRTSRIPSYDQSARNALLSSNPFPPLPDQVTVPKISGTFRFFYNMWSEDEDAP